MFYITWLKNYCIIFDINEIIFFIYSFNLYHNRFFCIASNNYKGDKRSKKINEIQRFFIQLKIRCSDRKLESRKLYWYILEASNLNKMDVHYFSSSPIERFLLFPNIFALRLVDPLPDIDH